METVAGIEAARCSYGRAAYRRAHPTPSAWADQVLDLDRQGAFAESRRREALRQQVRRLSDRSRDR